jgi:CCR4-NOT transcription complex subunit 9
MAMFQNPNMYGNHNYEPHGGAAWMHQQQSSHHTQHQVQQQAAAAAAAQQQHYSRIGAQNNAAAAGMNSAVQLHDGLEPHVSEDNRRTLVYVADLLKESTREAALLELSKKREQVPELALILWHSFGMFWLDTIE